MTTNLLIIGLPSAHFPANKSELYADTVEHLRREGAYESLDGIIFGGFLGDLVDTPTKQWTAFLTGKPQTKLDPVQKFEKNMQQVHEFYQFVTQGYTGKVHLVETNIDIMNKVKVGAKGFSYGTYIEDLFGSNVELTSSRMIEVAGKKVGISVNEGLGYAEDQLCTITLRRHPEGNPLMIKPRYAEGDGIDRSLPLSEQFPHDNNMPAIVDVTTHNLRRLTYAQIESRSVYEVFNSRT